MQTFNSISIEDIRKAKVQIQGVIHQTPMDPSRTFSEMVGSQVYLKRENEQLTGSFKIRGAYNKISQLTAAERTRGVIACSAGNHAQGVALSAKLLGVSATIVMPQNAPMIKVDATRGYGADVILHGQIVDESAEYARQLSKEKGYLLVHPFEDPSVIAGQGTIGLEILSQLPEVDTVIVPIGGGGLIAGIASVLKNFNKDIKVYGVQSAKVPSMAQTFRNKKIDGEIKISSTIADGIAVKRPSPFMYENFISKLVDDVVTVDEDEIAEAIVLLMERCKTVVEGAGATAVAALLHKGQNHSQINNQLKLGRKTCVVLSGGNIDMNLVEKIIDRGMSRRGRIARLAVIVGDIPGQLNRLTECISMLKANILEVSHDRNHESVGIMETRIDFILEANGFDHVEKIKQHLAQMGIKII